MGFCKNLAGFYKGHGIAQGVKQEIHSIKLTNFTNENQTLNKCTNRYPNPSHPIATQPSTIFQPAIFTPSGPSAELCTAAVPPHDRSRGPGSRWAKRLHKEPTRRHLPAVPSCLFSTVFAQIAPCGRFVVPRGAVCGIAARLVRFRWFVGVGQRGTGKTVWGVLAVKSDYNMPECGYT